MGAGAAVLPRGGGEIGFAAGGTGTAAVVEATIAEGVLVPLLARGSGSGSVQALTVRAVAHTAAPHMSQARLSILIASRPLS